MTDPTINLADYEVELDSPTSTDEIIPKPWSATTRVLLLVENALTRDQGLSVLSLCKSLFPEEKDSAGARGFVRFLDMTLEARHEVESLTKDFQEATLLAEPLVKLHDVLTDSPLHVSWGPIANCMREYHRLLKLVAYTMDQKAGERRLPVDSIDAIHEAISRIRRTISESPDADSPLHAWIGTQLWEIEEAIRKSQAYGSAVLTNAVDAQITNAARKAEEIERSGQSLEISKAFNEYADLLKNLAIAVGLAVKFGPTAAQWVATLLGVDMPPALGTGGDAQPLLPPGPQSPQ